MSTKRSSSTPSTKSSPPRHSPSSSPSSHSPAPSSNASPVGERPSSVARSHHEQQQQDLEHDMQYLSVAPAAPQPQQHHPFEQQAQNNSRRFSSTSIVSLDPSFESSNSFGISFDGTAHFAATSPFTSSNSNQHASSLPTGPPQPPSYGATDPRPQLHTLPSTQLLTPVMLFTAPLPFVHAQQQSPFVQYTPYTPQQAQQQTTQHSEYTFPPAANQPFAAASALPLDTASIATEPTPSYGGELGRNSQVEQGYPQHQQQQQQPPPAPRKTRPSISTSELGPPLRTCDVYTCFRPTFCELSPCGCGICREHLGSVIRGAKVVGVDEEVAGDGDGEGGEGSGESGKTKKVFECVACQTKSTTAGPARRSSGDSTTSGGAELGLSNVDERGAVRSGDEGMFSIHYQPQQSRASPSIIKTTPPTPSPATYGHGAQPLAVTAQQQSPQRYGTMQDMNDQVATMQQADGSFVQLIPQPPPPPMPLTGAAPIQVQQPQTSFKNSTQRDLPPHLVQHPPTFSQPLPPDRTSPELRRARAFSTPSGNGGGGSRFATGANTSRFAPNEQRRFSSAVASGGAGNEKWHDPRGPKDDPNEPYQLAKPLWPLIKVENIPFSTTVSDLEHWLPSHCLPSPENVPSSIHLILHRATGRTLPHCYLEMATLQIANDVILAMDRKQLGDRTVRIKWERRGEMMRDLFSQEGYFAIPAPTPAASPLPPVPVGFVLPSTIITDEDLGQLVSYCQRSLVPYKERPPERAFLNVVSIISKFPWAEEQLYTKEERDSIFHCVYTCVTIAARYTIYEPIFASCFNKLRASVGACVGFTEEQKNLTKAVDVHRLAREEREREVQLPHTLPPSPRESRRSSLAAPPPPPPCVFFTSGAMQTPPATPPRNVIGLGRTWE